MRGGWACAYFDTAPLYGRGLSETRCGLALAAMPRNELVLSTKVGRLLVPTETGPVDDHWPASPPLQPVFDFSRDGVLRSLEESLERLGLDRVDIALVHDLDTAMAEDPEHYRRARLPTVADRHARMWYPCPWSICYPCIRSVP